MENLTTFEICYIIFSTVFTVIILFILIKDEIRTQKTQKRTHNRKINSLKN